MAWTSPSTWVAGAVVTAAQLNAQVRDNFKAIGDPWTSYTPTWTASTTNPTIGNGTLLGSYSQAGKLVHFRIRVTFGSTSTVGSGTYFWTLPVTAISTHIAVAQGFIRNSAGSTRAYRFARTSASGIIALEDASGAAVTHAVPLAWANGDIIDINGTYEAA